MSILMQEGKRLPENADARMRAVPELDPSTIPPEQRDAPETPADMPPVEPEKVPEPLKEEVPAEPKSESSSLNRAEEAPKVETKTEKTARASKKSKLKK